MKFQLKKKKKSKMTATESTNVQIIAGATEGDIQIGQTYTVRRPDGTLHEATIIQIRETEDKTNEYYVHYSGLNRRLDQWVTVDQILSANTIDDDDNTSGDSKSKCIFVFFLTGFHQLNEMKITKNYFYIYRFE